MIIIYLTKVMFVYSIYLIKIVCLEEITNIINHFNILN
jgi:hypothetical protein